MAWQVGIYQMSYLKSSFYCEIYPHIGKHTYTLGLHITTYSQWPSIDEKKMNWFCEN